jgi:predicted phage replisome organizer
MADISWIKIKTDMFADEKIKLIQALPEGDSILVIWIRLILLGGKCNSGGMVYLQEDIPYTEDMLATIFNKPLNTVKLALTTFDSFNMIERSTKGIYLVNFQKHQNLDGLERVKHQNRIRKQNQRAKEKEASLALDNHSHVTCHADVTQCHATEEEKEEEKEKDINNIYSSNEEYYPTSNSDSGKIDYQAIVDSYNRICTDLPSVRAVSEERKRKIKALINALAKAKVLVDLDVKYKFEYIFKLAQESDFLTGRQKANGWCGFDWLVNSTNAIKVIEGTYSNSKGGGQNGGYKADSGQNNRGMDASDAAEKAAIEAFRNRQK